MSPPTPPALPLDPTPRARRSNAPERPTPPDEGTPTFPSMLHTAMTPAPARAEAPSRNAPAARATGAGRPAAASKAGAERPEATAPDANAERAATAGAAPVVVDPVVPNAAAPGGAASAAAPGAAGAVPPRHSDTAGLDPEFRTRLERVIDRLRAEFGYRVEIVETVRSQARQDALFHQGRTVPGPVVTWTRQSQHLVGRAADVIINGRYDDPQAYARLAAVAAEEGLRTLGPTDAGHLELARTVVGSRPSRAGSAGGVSMPLAPASHQASGPSAMPVATVATVATVARVARVAVPMVGARQTTASTGAPSHAAWSSATKGGAGGPAFLSSDLTAANHAVAGDVDGEAAGGAPGTGGDVPDRTATAERHLTTESALSADAHQPAVEIPRSSLSVGIHVVRQDGESSPGYAPPAPTPMGDPITVADAAAAGSPVDAAERVARMLDLRDAAGERPLSSMLLTLDRPDGGAERIRIDARGASIGAMFETADPALAEDLGRHLPELAHLLERQGLEPEVMTVRTARTATGWSLGTAVDLDRARAALLAGDQGAAGRDRRPQGGSPHDAPSDDSPRQRPRHHSRGDR